MKEVKFPIIGIICDWNGYSEDNYLYTPKQLSNRDPDLLYRLLVEEPGSTSAPRKGVNFAKSDILSDSNKIAVGFLIKNREMLFSFLNGFYNKEGKNSKNTKDWYWENVELDLYALKDTKLMKRALKMYLEGLEFSRMLTISSAHISEKTAEWIDRIGVRSADITIYSKSQYGWLIYIPEYETDTKELPEDLLVVMDFARKHKVEWLCIDSDGEVLEDYGLKTYKWEN